MNTITRILSAILMAAGAFGLTAQSVPPLINYQGQLLAANGSPLPTGDYEIELNLYPVEAGGAVVWGPLKFNGQSGPGLRPKVSAFEGRFNLVLGPEDTTGRQLAEVVAASPALYLEIKVGTGSPIAPRQQLLTAPYALSAAKAQDAVQLGGYDWSSVFANGNPQTGNMGIGVAPSTLKLDVNGRMRARQGADPSAGIWFNQNIGGAELDRAFVGMLDNNTVGFYTALGAGWALTVDGLTGISSALALNVGGDFRLGSAILYTTTFFGEQYLWVNGINDTYFFSDVWATAFHTTSDERLKENIETIENPLHTLDAIRGVAFNFKENPARTDLDSHHRRAGVLAQDVQKVLPEAVTSGPDGYLSVDYNALIPVLIEAVKEQQKQIDILQEELESLKAERF
jgi:hypothetical protein